MESMPLSQKANLGTIGALDSGLGRNSFAWQHNVPGAIGRQVALSAKLRNATPATTKSRDEMHAHEVHAHEAYAYEVPAYEVPAYEVPAYEVPAYEVPAYEVPAHEVHACEALMRCTPMRCTPINGGNCTSTLSEVSSCVSPIKLPKV